MQDQLQTPTYFASGLLDWEGELPENLFHPSRVLRGVHAGVRVGGNESGIPTVNGAIVFDDRYIGKPLVYCGTIGIMPRKLADGRESHIKNPQSGDRVYMVAEEWAMMEFTGPPFLHSS